MRGIREGRDIGNVPVVRGVRDGTGSSGKPSDSSVSQLMEYGLRLKGRETG